MALIKTRARGLKLDDNFAFTGTITGAGGGKILQVQSAHITSSVTSITSSSFTATEITDQITPSATTSKVFVLMCCSASQYEDSGTSLKYKAAIYRSINGGSYSRVYAGQDNTYDGYSGFSSGELSSSNSTVLTFVDSPNTTNAVDYKLYLARAGTANSVNTGSSAMERSVTLMEIGA